MFDRDLPGRTAPRVGEDTNVFQPHEMLNDLGRIDVHRGVDDSLFRHTKRLKRLCVYVVDLRDYPRSLVGSLL